MPIRILTALVNIITIRKAFYISSAFFLFSNQTYNHLFLFRNVGVIQFCCKYLFYLHIVNGRTNNGFFLVSLYRILFPKKKKQLEIYIQAVIFFNLFTLLNYSVNHFSRIFIFE